MGIEKSQIFRRPCFKMKFPEKYIQRGERVLHSGQKSNVFYDVNALLTDSFYIEKILDNVPYSKHYIGIATGGAIVGAIVARNQMTEFSMIKDGELKGEQPVGNWILIDDVVTTGISLKEAIRIVRKTPEKIVAVLDRREDKSGLEVLSLFEV